jgi:uncharacterized protein (TIGR02453 family)
MFTGFSPETIDFLWGIRFNNEKSWFDAHKEAYLKTLLAPMKELTKELWEPFSEEPGMACKPSRIYRDARRIHNGGPYKETLWVSFRPDSMNWSELPCLFFEIGAETYDYGFLMWMPKAATMQAFRTRIADRPDNFLKIAEKVRRETGLEITGREYYRKKESPDPRLVPYYNLKNLQAYVEKPVDELLFSPALVDEVRRTLVALLPLYRFAMGLTV